MLPRRRTPSLGFTAGRRTTRPRPARGLSEALAREVAGDQGVDERRFGVETVARLWPDARGRAVDDLVGDLLAAVGRQWRKMAARDACAIRAASTVKPANAARRVSPSASLPIEVQTSA